MSTKNLLGIFWLFLQPQGHLKNVYQNVYWEKMAGISRLFLSTEKNTISVLVLFVNNISEAYPEVPWDQCCYEPEGPVFESPRAHHF